MGVIEAPTRAVTVADILDRAADVLEEYDWCQGKTGSRDDGEFCAIGAIQEAARDLGLNPYEDDIVRDACFAKGKPERESDLFPLATWNDEPERTKAEVVAFLREAAEEQS